MLHARTIVTAFLLSSLPFAACGSDDDEEAETSAPDITDTDEVDSAEGELGDAETTIPTDVIDATEASDSETIDSADVTDTMDATDAPDSAEGDTAPPELPADDPSLRFALAGSIQIIETFSDGAGEVTGSWVQVDLRDKVAPPTYDVQAEAGACKVWTHAVSACEPACGADQTCTIGATCQAQAQPISAGDLTITGLVVSPLGAVAGDFGYVFSPEPPMNGLFDAGAAITVTAAGGALPAFTGAVLGVADFGIEGVGLLELVDGQDASISWSPAGDDSHVELVLQLGWHGAPPTGIIVCRAPDSAGKLVVPASIIAKFPYFGGIGLFQNPSWAERVSRTLVASPAGPIEITASSRLNIGVSHSEP